MYTDTSPTFETERGERTEFVVVNLELLQRWRQFWNPGELVAIQVQLLQKGQVLHDKQQKRRVNEPER